MSYLHAAGLGLVQGLAEFLPISSSAHLVLLPWLWGWTYQGKAYDAALHLGTLIAIAAYFWKDWAELIRTGCSRRSSPQRRRFWGIVLATIPGGLAGLLLEKHMEKIFNSPTLVSGTLIAFGIILWACDRLGKKARGLQELGLGEIFYIGLAQSLAVVPGVSRSGITITAGLCLGLKREEAARFSFLLSVPIVAAAGLFEMRHLNAAAMNGSFWLGIAVTALTGLAAIRFLLSYLQKSDISLFAVYRILLGLFCVVWAWR